jgi:hypothetical protein
VFDSTKSLSSGEDTISGEICQLSLMTLSLKTLSLKKIQQEMYFPIKFSAHLLENQVL